MQGCGLGRSKRPTQAADARELLAYDEDTAGGLMTTDFVALPRALTAGAAVARLRALDEPPDPLYHVYLIPEEGSWRLCGVVALRALLLAPPAAPLARLGDPDYRTVRADERPEAVAHVMAEYDLPDLPVVDAAGDILGVVLIDDAVDVLYPVCWPFSPSAPQSWHPVPRALEIRYGWSKRPA